MGAAHFFLAKTKQKYTVKRINFELRTMLSCKQGTKKTDFNDGRGSSGGKRCRSGSDGNGADFRGSVGNRNSGSRGVCGEGSGGREAEKVRAKEELLSQL